MDFTVDEVIEYLSQDGVTADYDDQFVTGGTIKSLGCNTKIARSAYKGMMFISGRDFCLVSTTVVKPTESIIAATSCEHEDCPLDTKYVRGEVVIGGWILKPNEDPSKADAIYISQSDLKGKIPQGVTNSVCKKQGLTIQKVNNAMKKRA